MQSDSQIAGISCLLSQVVVLLLAMANAAQTMPGESLDYATLRTVRKEIEQRERILVSRPDRIEFDVPDGRVIAEFAVAECDTNGWRVPAGTLIFLNVVPKNRVGIKDVDLAGLPFTLLEDNRFYVNRRDGIEYQFRQDNRGTYLGMIRRVPKASDSDLRCRGFPEYDPLSDHYVAYDAAIIPSIREWDVTRVVTTTEAAKQKSYRAFIFVYCPSKQRKLANEIIKKIDAFVLRSYGKIPGNLMIAFGGVRSQCQFESFLIPRDLPDVRPRPTQSR